jgi:hypothetical protein
MFLRRCEARRHLLSLLFDGENLVETRMSERSAMYESFITGALRSVTQGISSRSMDED